jgi:hypothetical protein
VIVCLAQKFDASRVGESFEIVDHLGAMGFHLLKDDACDRKGDLEIPFVLPDKLQHHSIGRKIALLDYFFQDYGVLFVVFVPMVSVDIEEGKMSVPARLMDLEVTTNRRHVSPQTNGSRPAGRTCSGIISNFIRIARFTASRDMR